MKKMTNGDFLTLLNFVKSDKDLRLEVRQSGKAFVYYRKGKAIEIGLNKFRVDEKYVKNTVFSIPDTEWHGSFSVWFPLPFIICPIILDKLGYPTAAAIAP